MSLSDFLQRARVVVYGENAEGDFSEFDSNMTALCRQFNLFQKNPHPSNGNTDLQQIALNTLIAKLTGNNNNTPAANAKKDRSGQFSLYNTFTGINYPLAKADDPNITWNGWRNSVKDQWNAINALDDNSPLKAKYIHIRQQFLAFRDANGLIGKKDAFKKFLASDDYTPIDIDDDADFIPDGTSSDDDDM